MSPKTLQMIMGHSSIEFTLNVYTHIEDEDIVQSFQSLQERGQIGFGTYDPSQTVAPDDDEGEVDLDERADDDDEE